MWFLSRRRKLLAQPLPGTWEGILAHNVRHDRLLGESDRVRLRQTARVLVAEKKWVGCNGLEISEEICVTIAAGASLLVLGSPGFYFPRVKSILVYPEIYTHPRQQLGLLVAEDVPVSGEAWYRGPVILSWRDVLRGARNPYDGHNVTIHEFAHQLDALDGAMDGTLPWTMPGQRERWEEVLQREFDDLRHQVEHGEPTLLDPYGASNRSELFAVASECFFELPLELRSRHGELYELLAAFYHQDPATWPGLSM